MINYCSFGWWSDDEAGATVGFSASMASATGTVGESDPGATIYFCVREKTNRILQLPIWLESKSNTTKWLRSQLGIPIFIHGKLINEQSTVISTTTKKLSSEIIKRYGQLQMQNQRFEGGKKTANNNNKKKQAQYQCVIVFVPCR